MHNLKIKIAFIIVFLLGTAAGLFINKPDKGQTEKDGDFYARRLFKDDGHLSNPLLEYERPQDGDLKLDSTKYAIQQFIDARLKSGDAARIAVYLKDLDKGSWIGINEEDDFASASLFKVPLMIVYLRCAEDDPAILSKKIKFEQKINNIPQNIAPQAFAQPGNEYTVEELLGYMIRNSDNNSKDLLLNNIDLKLIAKLYADLHLGMPDLEESEHEISSKDYATFFRVLYNSTYLNNAMSEKALRLLSETDFQDGIVAGVPAGVTVAHKFAERKYTTGGAQLHDCGIVYYPKKPYLICIMTRGGDFDTLKDIIKNISRLAYEGRKDTSMGLY